MGASITLGELGRKLDASIKDNQEQHAELKTTLGRIESHLGGVKDVQARHDEQIKGLMQGYANLVGAIIGTFTMTAASIIWAVIQFLGKFSGGSSQ